MGVVNFDSGKCSGCWACTMTCADQNDLDMKTADCAFRLVNPVERERGTGYIFSYGMHGCMHCENPDCMTACPCGCYSIAENRLVLLDNSACIGCGMCAEACEYDAVIIRGGTAAKCNGCTDRISAGLRPACEKICPSGALKFDL